MTNPGNSNTNPREAGQAAHTPTPSQQWFVGNPIRSTDTAGICVTHFDGEPIEETIAEVLPSTDGNKTRDLQAAFIVRACNSHAALVAALEEMLFRFEHNEEFGDEDAPAIQQARAALAAAKE